MALVVKPVFSGLHIAVRRSCRPGAELPENFSRNLAEAPKKHLGR